MNELKKEDFIKAIRLIFPPLPEDKYIGILVDIPKTQERDNENWEARRDLAEDWYYMLKDNCRTLGLEGALLIAYTEVGSNNADLPQNATVIEKFLPPIASKIEAFGESTEFEVLFKNIQLILAPTEYSTTAPLKNAAKEYKFRAATMPGFSLDMIPAFQIDYDKVHNNVQLIKYHLDRAVDVDARFLVDNEKEYKMNFDIRKKKAHASSGRFPEIGTAGNFPSGEAYIVPYEGGGTAISQTEGFLPVQFEDDIVIYEIRENKVVNVTGEGKPILQEKEHLKREPAYGNMAEVGFGVLGEFGIKHIGEILLDEKLGFHVAFGRSDHFGGEVGPSDFSSPEEVVHIDRIYISSIQPRISVQSVNFVYGNSQSDLIIKNNKYFLDLY